MRFFLSLFSTLMIAYAAKLETYLDANCSTPITNFLAFADVCTWGTDRYNGAFSITLSQCSTNSLEVNIYNATEAPTCQEAAPVLVFNATPSCTRVQDFYVRAENTSCISENYSYNVLAHFTENCTDGGLAFSIYTGNTPCEEAAFAPGLLSYDTGADYLDPFYMLTLYNSSNGTCSDGLAIFMTESFPAQCLKPIIPYNNMAIDIYNSFPMISQA
jgi:hypothetical protein